MKNAITKESILNDLKAIKDDLKSKAKEIEQLADKYNMHASVNYCCEYTNMVKAKYPFAYHYLRSGVGLNSLEYDSSLMAFIMNNKEYYLLEQLYILQEMPQKLSIKFFSFSKDRFEYSLEYINISNELWQIEKEYNNGNAIIKFVDKATYDKVIEFLNIPFNQTDEVLKKVDDDFIQLAKKKYKESNNRIWSVSSTIYTLIGEGFHQVNYNSILKQVGL